jgi:hypothetical protein
VGCRRWVLFMATALDPGLVAAQMDQPTLSYTAAQLECSQFLETSSTTILTQSGRRNREQTAGRRAVWRFKAAPVDTEVALEGWMDSLAVWRRSPEATIRPDTDGLIGGRYRGALQRDGRYLGRVRPFVPDEVAEVAGLATALDDFFPPLPPRQLHSGEVWTDSLGTRIQRLADSALSGLPLYRYALESTHKTQKVPLERDTISMKLDQVSRERGTFVWHPTLGLLSRDRQIVIETNVPAGPAVREPVRSRIEQRIKLVRDLRVPVGQCSGSAATPQAGTGASAR